MTIKEYYFEMRKNLAQGIGHCDSFNCIDCPFEKEGVSCDSLDSFKGINIIKKFPNLIFEEKEK